MLNRIKVVFAALVALVVLSSCALLDQGISDLNALFKGRPGVMQTFDQYGVIIDSINAQSFQVEQDTQFNSTSTTSKGETVSNKDSEVLSITLGGKNIRHVGSTLIFAQTGLNEVFRAGGGTVAFRNADPSIPFLNRFIENNRNLWKGGAKTLFIRSQNGSPIAIYSGSEVEIYASSVPKSTVFRVDKLYLFVYRADYTVYDTSLIGA